MHGAEKTVHMMSLSDRRRFCRLMRPKLSSWSLEKMVKKQQSQINQNQKKFIVILKANKKKNEEDILPDIKGCCLLGLAWLTIGQETDSPVCGAALACKTN